MHQRISKNKQKSNKALCLPQVMSVLDLSSHYLRPPSSGKALHQRASLNGKMEQFAYNSCGVREIFKFSPGVQVR